MKTLVYIQINRSLAAYHNCVNSSNSEWEIKHREKFRDIIKENLPRGSGFDAGTTLNEDESVAGEKLVFDTSFHHMDEHGGYDGWTEHRVVVKPSFEGIDIRVTGRDRNQIKEYIAEMFHHALNQVID